MPFPGLYFGAQASLEGARSDYKFASYDLVYVIAPQVRPIGTKGVAYVGKKGAMCNGCETISDNFKIMVAVHELGHNLGLFHASSSNLEYGNVFDWMGNYPDVVGLSYGLGYKLRLHWTPKAAVVKISDQDLYSLNDEYLIRPYDEVEEPREGELLGLQLSFKDNSRDIFVSYRSTIGDMSGVFLTKQDKDKPNSELIDCACHTPSQRDARLRPGWTYIDPS